MHLRSFMAWAATLGTTSVAAIQASAPYLIHYFPPADILVNSVQVPRAPTVGTYYEVLGWDFGLEGAGYTGIQWTRERNPSGGPAFIFSLWDPVSSHVPIATDYLDPGTETRAFGGEGTGLNSMNWTLGWQPDRWYTAVVRRWSCQGTSTCFGHWVYKHTEQQWTHNITMVYPVANTLLGTSAYSFVEDFGANGLYRSARFRDAWARTAAGWVALNRPYFTAGISASMPNEYNAFLADGVFNLEAGSGVTLTQQPDTYLPAVAMASAPEFPPAVIATLNASLNANGTSATVNWAIGREAAPQFAYRVRVFGLGETVVRHEASAILPQGRSLTVPLAAGNSWRIELQVTDVFDRTSTEYVALIPRGTNVNPAQRPTDIRIFSVRIP
jgi:hypothetical protein